MIRDSSPANHFIGLAIPLLLLLGTFVAFWPARDVQFVNIDDEVYVTQNQHVLGGLTGNNVAWAFTTGYAENWHPLTWLSLMLDAQMFGRQAWGYHLTNVLLHTLNVLLLYSLLRKMTGSGWRSALVAGLFAIHPLRAESVAWVTERKDVLSIFWGLLAMLAYVKAARLEGKRGKLWWILLTCVLYALSLMSKPMLVTLPLLLLLLDIWPLRRWAGPLQNIRQDDRALGAWEVQASPFPRASWRVLLWEKSPLLLLALASSMITFWVASQSVAMRTLGELSVPARLSNALVSYVRYLGMMFWPAGLAMFYPLPPHWPLPWVAGSALLLLGISLGVFRLRRSQAWLLVGWKWYLIAMLPVIGLVHVGQQSIADRYTYFPSIGIAIMLAWSIPQGWVRSALGRGLAGGGAAVVLVGLIVLTRIQVDYWHDSISLARHACEAASPNYLAEKNLGTALSDAGQPEEGIRHLEEALRIKPDYFPAYFDIAAIDASHGRLDLAAENYRRAIALHDSIAQIHINLANTLAQMGDSAGALRAYHRALELDPASAEAHNNLGVLMGRLGDNEGALREYEAAAVADPDYVMARRNLGLALLSRGRVDRAIGEFEAVLRLAPGDAVAQEGLKQARGLKVSEGR